MVENAEKSIELDEIILVRDKLRGLSNQWAALLAKKMFFDPEHPALYDRVKARDSIYNIIHGVTRDNEKKVRFVTCAAELLSELEVSQKLAHGVLSVLKGESAPVGHVEVVAENANNSISTTHGEDFYCREKLFLRDQCEVQCERCASKNS